MNSDTSLSILITYYNEKTLLTECLRSVYNQTVLPDEVLIYDDASLYPAKDYLIFDPRLKVKLIVGDKNIMLSAARNKLMELASSKYIRYQDADDLLEPNCVEEIKNKLNSVPSIDLIVNEVRSINFETGNIISNGVMSLNKFSGSLVSFALSGSLLTPSTTFRRDIGIALNGYKAGELLQCEDFEFNTRLAFHSVSYKIVETPLVIQRVRKNSMSSNSLELYREAIKALILLESELLPVYKKELAEAFARFGHKLYTLGDVKAARFAFLNSKRLSKISFKGRSKLFSFIANWFSYEFAERLSLLFQKLKNSNNNYR